MMTKKIKPTASPPMPDNFHEVMKWLGARGGKKGGPARWRGVSAADRKAYSNKMIEARELKRAAKRKAAHREAAAARRANRRRA